MSNSGLQDKVLVGTDFPLITPQKWLGAFADLTLSAQTSVSVSVPNTRNHAGTINKFADATGDDQWIHVDPERTKDGPFGAPIKVATIEIEGQERPAVVAEFVARFYK